MAYKMTVPKVKTIVEDHFQNAISTKTYIDLPEATEPASPSANNLRLFVTNDEGFSILSFKDSGGMVRKFVKDAVFIGYNDSGDTIAAARIVYASGSTASVPTIALAKADSSSTMPAIGVTLESSTNNSYVRIMQVGLLEDVNTSAYSAGDILYVSAATAGIPTGTAPSYPNIRQEIGTILVDSATVGSIQIIARSAFDDTVISYVHTIEHHTADDTLTRAESGSVHTNLGEDGAVTLTLPQDATAGEFFEFVVMTAQELRVDPGAAGAIYINGAKQTDNMYITANDEGESVKLVADGNGDWIAMYTQGTWGVEA